MKKCLKNAVSLCVVLTAVACFGWSRDGEVPWRRMDDSLVTPHRKFASPVAGKKLKAMMFCSGLAQREIIELKQRFEYDYILFPQLSKKVFSPFDKGGSGSANSMTAEDYMAERKKLIAMMPGCDMFVVGKFKFTTFPEDVKAPILARVKNGATLIQVFYDGTTDYLPGLQYKDCKIDFPVNAVPSLRQSVVKVASLGKGKVLAIRFKGGHNKPFVMNDQAFLEQLTPFECDHPLYYDYALAFFGKCMWSVAEPGRLIFDKLASDGSVSLKKAPPAKSTFAYEFVDIYGNVLAKGKLKAAKNTRIPIPKLPNTVRMLDVKLLDAAGKVIDFQTTPVAVDNGNKISVALAKEGYQPDEPVKGKIVLAKPAKGTVELTFTDEKEKMIWRQTWKADRKEIPFSIPLKHQQSNWALVQAKLYQDNRLFDEAQTDAYFDTCNREVDTEDFAFGMWSYAGSNARIDHEWLRMMAREGVDNLMCNQTPWTSSTSDKHRFTPRRLKRLGIRYGIYIARCVTAHWLKYYNKCAYGFWEQYQKTGKIDENSPEMRHHYSSLVSLTKQAKDVGVYFYNLGDENMSSMSEKDENCFCADCQRRFRNYLKTQYKNLAALNKEYGSAYKSFDEIKAIPFAKAMESGKFSLWFDFRCFTEIEFANWHRYLKAVIRKFDPNARVGLEGMVYPHSSFTGFNLPYMLPHFQFCAPYFVSRDVRAVNKYLGTKDKGRGLLRSAWFGSYDGEMTDHYVMQPPWRYLFGGLGGAFYWYSGSPVNAFSFANNCISGPDMRPLTQFTKAAEQIRTIKNSGVGMMLINSARPSTGVYMHYSNLSLHGATLNPDKTSWEISMKEFNALIDWLGISMEYLSPEEMERGIPKDAKLLILPYSQAMSAKEAENIRTFVRNGGTVVTDFNPAILSEHGKFLEKSRLADVFGKFEKLHVNKFGKGYAFYLGDYLSGVDARIQRKEANGILSSMLKIFAKAGVTPFAVVKDGDGKYMDVSVFANNNDRYVCLLGQRDAPAAAKKSTGAEAGTTVLSAQGGSFRRTVTLAKPMHVYDVLNGHKYLGKIKQIQTVLKPAEGRIFACLEHVAKTPVISCASAKTVKAGSEIRFKIRNLDKTAIVTIRDAKGNVVHEQRTIRPEVRFIPAFNDPAGNYTATVKDVIGGKQTQVKFTVQK